MLDLGRYGSREIMNLQVLDYITATPLMYFDYANTASDESAGDRTFATGGSGGTRRIKFDGAKTRVLTVETQIFTLQHLAILAGNPITSGAKNIYKTEVVKVSTGKTISLKRKPLGVAFVSVLPYKNGIAIGKPQEVQTVTDNLITLAATSTVAIGDEVEVYYQFEATSAHTVTYTTKGFPGYVTLIGDTFYADEVGSNGGTTNLVAVQKKYFKASMQPNYTVTHNATGDAATLTMVFDIFGVKVDGEEVMVEETIYEDELV
ncbi:hypothetical protein [Paenibacillus donghaensis]|uniref:Uncharacterized protein n=1 Tax=Paenibacillus donghaensis TaxID=414771 RepID=A0A2Z2KF82_9BACL|nr:hypothetical protein [Paenibacillus donghaensis]ASA21820.1 hypothetical protein B9T62_14180 [Paenibacillus donghaensis]